MDITAGTTDCYYFGCLTAKCTAPSTAYPPLTSVTYENAELFKYPL